MNFKVMKFLKRLFKDFSLKYLSFMFACNYVCMCDVAKTYLGRVCSFVKVYNLCVNWCYVNQVLKVVPLTDILQIYYKICNLVILDCYYFIFEPTTIHSSMKRLKKKWRGKGPTHTEPNSVSSSKVQTKVY